jgi:hypothetical protein
MITFRCTQKVRDLLGLHDRDLSDETDDDLQETLFDGKATGATTIVSVATAVRHSRAFALPQRR